MHFCPRDECREWYHESCLHSDGSVSNKSLDERAQEFLDISQVDIGRIPPDLLRLARTPIIRGGLTYGTVGNVKAVCEAREWAKLYAFTPWSESRPILMNGITLDRWLDSVDGFEVEELIYPEDGESPVCKRTQSEEVPFVCPSCKKPI